MGEIEAATLSYSTCNDAVESEILTFMHAVDHGVNRRIHIICVARMIHLEPISGPAEEVSWHSKAAGPGGGHSSPLVPLPGAREG